MFCDEADMTIVRRDSKEYKKQFPKIWSNFMSSAKSGLNDCLNYLIKNVSYNTPLIRYLTALDPVIQQTHECTTVDI